jgi:hypothetical protein
MAESPYTILATIPTVYNDPDLGVVNGVLVRFRIYAYNEVHEVRIPKLDAAVAQAAILAVVTERDKLAALSG